MSLVFKLLAQITFEVIILLSVAVITSSLFLGYVGMISKHYNIGTYNVGISNIRNVINSSLFPFREFKISVG